MNGYNNEYATSIRTAHRDGTPREGLRVPKQRAVNFDPHSKIAAMEELETEIPASASGAKQRNRKSESKGIPVSRKWI